MPAEARRVVMDMVERDPLYRPGVRNAVNSYLFLGRPDQAMAHLDRVRPLIPNDSVISSSEAAIHYFKGELAEGMALADTAVALQSSNSIARITRDFVWMSTHQYEHILAEGIDWQRVFALTYLDRTEEASILAYQLADDEADVGTLFAFLNIINRSDEAIDYLEERWPDLASLRKDFPAYGGFGDGLMIDVALAYSRSGNQQRFDEAMGMVNTAHEYLKTQGINNIMFFSQEASYQALAGNWGASLDYLDRAVSGGAIMAAPISREWPALAVLEGDPKYEAIQLRMIEHLNAEREKLGLEPVST